MSTASRWRRRHSGAERGSDAAPSLDRSPAAEQQQQPAKRSSSSSGEFRDSVPAQMGQQLERAASAAGNRALHQQQQQPPPMQSKMNRQRENNESINKTTRIDETNKQCNIQVQRKQNKLQTTNKSAKQLQDSPARQRPQSALAGTATASQAATKPTKTTRVRINSTSEQIQDPNWLIRMSSELEEAGEAHQKAKSHLRNLHRKLKSTIANVASSQQAPALSQASAPTPTPQSSDSLTKSLHAAPSAASDNAIPPSTPTVKVPVSILKQRSATAISTNQQNNNNSPGLAGRRSPIPAHVTGGGHSPSAGGGPKQKQHAPNSRQIRQSQAGPATPPSPNPATPAAFIPQQEAPSVVKPTPICADGQVKVSGWKRNNLLAKTLSHFDEIRGNQRPVFVPTKIKLPEPAADRSARAPSPGKFADIVREAISKKSLLRNQESPHELSPQKRNSNFAADFEQQRPVSTEPQASPAQLQQHRSSSSAGVPLSPTRGPPSASNKQQVIHALKGKHSAPASPQAPHLMSQFLSASVQHHHLMVDSSSRQFKLQHKNNQVLQNLRRQSNELQAQAHGEDSSNADTCATSGSSPSTGGGSLKDWKRLTGKLALLTRSPVRRNSRDASEQALLPLRLTVSNQESSAATPNPNAARNRSGVALQVPSLLKPEQGRKLSSSSMVVQPVSSHSAAASPMLSAESAPGGAAESINCRRSSDSEAYRPASGGQLEGGQNSKQPVVVHRDDLLQLLQVAVSAPVGVNSGKRGSSASSGSERASPRRAEPSRQNSLPSGARGDDDDGGGDQFGRDNPAEAAEVGDDNDQVVRGAGKQGSAMRRKTDMSWVVRKSSKVAFFQQKLRKMRWHSKQRKAAAAADNSHPEGPASPSNSASNSEGAEEAPTNNELERQDEDDKSQLRAASDKRKTEDVFMDPTLIGDAIEIFLRSTMQNSANSSSANLAAAGSQTSEPEKADPG